MTRKLVKIRGIYRNDTWYMRTDDFKSWCSDYMSKLTTNDSLSSPAKRVIEQVLCGVIDQLNKIQSQSESMHQGVKH